MTCLKDRILTGLTVGTLLILPFMIQEVQGQTLSPSTTPQRTQANSKNQASQQPGNIEPSKQLLASLDVMIPFPVTGSPVEAELQEAARQFLTGDLLGTEKRLTEIREKSPTLPPAPTLIANMMFMAGQADLGNAWLEKSAKEFPNHPAALIRFAAAAVSQRRITDALALLEKTRGVVEAGSWDEQQTRLYEIELLNLETDVLVSRQELEKAKSNLLKLKEMLPNNGKVVIRLGQVEFDLGNIEQSVAYLNDALKLNQNINMPEIIISDWYSQKRDVEESKKWVSLAAEKYPDNPAVLLKYANWLLKNKQIDKASEVVRKAEQLGGDVYQVNYIKGQIAFSKRDYATAEIYFEQMYKLRPSDADVANMLALSLVSSVDPLKKSRALELATVNQRLYPKSPGAMATLGWINYQNGRKAEGEQAFRAVMGANNISSVSAYFVAAFLYDQGDLPAAKNLLQQALSSTDYFMYRESARELLKEVEAKMPASTEDASNGPTPVGDNK